MSNYYLAVVFITITSMMVGIIHFRENQTLSRKVKQPFLFIASFIVLGVICECLGICLNSSTLPNTIEIHKLIKVIEFTITPLIPAFYLKIFEYENIKKSIRVFAVALLVLNTVFEIINMGIPFVFYIDENNVYQHGNFYIVYILIYCMEIGIFIFELLIYTKKYQIRNIATLISIIAFLSIGLSIRIIDSSVNSDWLIVAITYLLFIIYYSDLSLKVDPLTGLLNRKSYEHKLKKIDYTTAFIMMDINNFKQINDQLGHSMGDVFLKLVSSMIMENYSKYGYCYRIGGDEFCVILKAGVLEKETIETFSKLLDNLNSSFDKLLLAKSEDYPSLKYGVAKGYSIYFADYNQNLFYENDPEYLLSIQKAIDSADKMLYVDKKNK